MMKVAVMIGVLLPCVVLGLRIGVVRSKTGSWQTTSGNRGCRKNSEGVSPSGIRENMKNTAACRDSCERRANCIAVDWYRTTKTCIFYNRPCLAPLEDVDGASSYRIVRETDWQALSMSAACEKNDDGIKPLTVNPVRPSKELKDCQNACTYTIGCVAVDFYKSTGHCNLYSAPCKTPQASHDGASSYIGYVTSRILTVDEIKVADFDTAKSRDSSLWRPLSGNKACLKNTEGITPLKEAVQVADKKACFKQCYDFNPCLAIDFFSTNKYCLLYSEPCEKPLAADDDRYGSGGSSWVVDAEKWRKGDKGALLEWKMISNMYACQSNHDDIAPIDYGTQKDSLAACKSACELHSKCTAVDFYRESNWCVMYDEACMVPLADHDGASSYRISRQPSVLRDYGGAGESKVEIKSNGFSVQKVSSSLPGMSEELSTSSGVVLTGAATFS